MVERAGDRLAQRVAGREHAMGEARRTAESEPEGAAGAVAVPDVRAAVATQLVDDAVRVVEELPDETGPVCA